MKKMTGGDFKNLIKKDPSWCKTLKEPLEITTPVDLTNSAITHLSPLIAFSGENGQGWAATFYGCKNLKIATGNFNGFADFRESGVEKIEHLTVIGKNHNWWSASFQNCVNLKVATGTFEGHADFRNSGVTTIKDLIIKNPKEKKFRAAFENTNITYIPKEYRESGFSFDKKPIENSIKKDTIDKIKSEENLIEI